MNRIISDFIYADRKRSSCAFFEGDQKAAEIAGRMSKNAKRKAKKYGLVPLAFYEYLGEAGIIDKDIKVLKCGTSLGELLDFLRWYPYKTEQAKSAGEYLFREIIKSDLPFLSKAFAQGDHNWFKLEFFGIRNRRGVRAVSI